MKNIAVLVSGGGTNLAALIKAQNSGIVKSGKINLVISSSRSAYALVRAEKAGIRSFVADKRELGDGFEQAVISELERSKTDLIVLAGFMSILSSDFIRRFEGRIINVHPSLIPAFCGKGFYGLRVHEAALSYGVKVTGATVHFVNEIPDGGKIIMQKAVKIQDGDTPESLQKKVMRLAEWKILPEATEKICALLEKGNENE